MLIKSLLIGLLLALAEVVNGTIRVRMLQKRFGLKRAKRVSFFSGVTVIFLICWFALPWIDPDGYGACALIGLIWLAILLALDLYFAKQVFKMDWSKIREDFNPMQGNLLGIGMLFLLVCPSIVFWLMQQ